MPELPEVETIKQDLATTVIGKKIINVSIIDKRVILPQTVAEFIHRLKQRSIIDIKRRGKALIFTLDNGDFLVVHLRMTGQLIVVNEQEMNPKINATKVIFTLSGEKYLNYNDQRLFGRLFVVQHLEEIGYFRTLGREPLEDVWDAAWLAEQLKKRKIPIKPFLLDQSVLAGIGNIYASEILFRAKVLPTRIASRLRLNEIDVLRKAIVGVLREAIKYRGTSMRNYRDAAGQKGNFINRISVYAREDQPCYSCGNHIKKIVQSGRSSFYCPCCQS